MKHFQHVGANYSIQDVLFIELTFLLIYLLDCILNVQQCNTVMFHQVYFILFYINDVLIPEDIHVA